MFLQPATIIMEC